jgi:aminotransferase EvaB
MDEIQAAILRFRLEQLDQLNTKRRKILAGFKNSIKTSSVNALWFMDTRSVGHLAVMSVDNREEVQKILFENQIMSEVHYPLLDCQQPAWLKKNCDLTNSEILVQKIITIPCFPQLTESEIHRIQNSISKF